MAYVTNEPSTSGQSLEKRSIGQKFGEMKPKLWGRRSVPFNVDLSALLADLPEVKLNGYREPVVLVWSRGDKAIATFPSEVESASGLAKWPDGLAQTMSLYSSGTGFKPKDCKFKVQVVQGPPPGPGAGKQKPGKLRTVAKTDDVDFSKFCSDIGLPREQLITIPLKPLGKLQFVVRTHPAPQEMATSQSRTSRGPSYAGNSESNLATYSQRSNTSILSSVSQFTGFNKAAAATDAPSTSARGPMARMSSSNGRPMPSAASETAPSGPSSYSKPSFFGNTRHSRTGSGLSDISATAMVTTSAGISAAQSPPSVAKATTSEMSRRATTGSSISGGVSESPAKSNSAGVADSRGRYSLNNAGIQSAERKQLSKEEIDKLKKESLKMLARDSDNSASDAGFDTASEGSPEVRGHRPNMGAAGSAGWTGWLLGGWSNKAPRDGQAPRTASATEKEMDSARLEEAIKCIPDVADLRELATDLLRQRDTWRNRAQQAEQGASRAEQHAQTERNESRRLAARLRDFEEELSRSQDGSLVQEFVNTKMKMAQLLEENVKLRRLAHYVVFDENVQA